MAKKINLIINADDYGLSPLFNQGIVELVEKKIISSFSVMIRRKFIDKIWLKNLKKISIGLHLELKLEDSAQEIELQINSFKEILGQLPSHLDSHKHTHFTEKNLPRIITIAKKYSLPIRSYKSVNRKPIKSAGLKTPDAFIGWHPERIRVLENDFEKLRVPTAEFVCHPGYYDKNSISSYNKQREQELNFLTSTVFKKLIKKFKKITYYDL